MGGGGKSETQQQTDQSTKITENTTTTIGDIGLTGDSAIGFANAVAAGSIAQTEAFAGVVAPLIELVADRRGSSVSIRDAEFIEKDRQTDNSIFPLLALGIGAAFFALKGLK